MALKYIKLVSFCFIPLFVGITYFTASFESMSDGNDMLGWPFVFYNFLGGKRMDNYFGKGWFFENLILDILIISGIFTLLTAMIQRLLNKYKTYL